VTMENKNEGMTLIVKTVARLTSWLILLYGFYLITHGHLTSGGGFAGGLVIALSFIHLTLAYGRNFVDKRINLGLMCRVMSGGGLAFLLLGWLSLIMTGKFFGQLFPKGRLFNLLSGGTVPLINVFIGLNVGLLLYIGFSYLVKFRAKGK
jgi:multisubunit Na+/H+ antiporter MnhB subunit